MTKIMAILLACLLSGCVTPGGGYVARGPEGKVTRERIEWSPETKRLYWTLAATRAVDVAMTHNAVQRGCVERNPIYGKKPSLGKLVGLSALGLGVVAWSTEYSVQHGSDPNRSLMFGIGLNGLVIGWNLTQIGSCGD